VITLPCEQALALQERRDGRLVIAILLLPELMQGERRIRATALYSRASLLNHECLPNVARFDAFDSVEFGPHTMVEFRALHDLPEGECAMWV
jgi:hypothetical protein